MTTPTNKRTRRQVKDLRREVKALRRELGQLRTAMAGAGAVLNVDAWSPR